MWQGACSKNVVLMTAGNICVNANGIFMAQPHFAMGSDEKC